MKRSTKELALCGVMTALSVVLLCLGGVIPLAIYACPMLASCALLVLREMCRAQYAWCCWASVALLTLLLGPDKEAAALYLFLGYYPLLQPKLDAIRRPALRWMAKLMWSASVMSRLSFRGYFSRCRMVSTSSSVSSRCS